MPDMQQTIKELQDTLTVVVGIQARQAELIKGHGEWLEDHDRAMARLQRELAEDRKRGCEIDERIDKLVSVIGELIRKPR
jgi:hypothetical protein